jgi:hypothetical protein
MLLGKKAKAAFVNKVNLKLINLSVPAIPKLEFQ